MGEERCKSKFLSRNENMAWDEFKIFNGMAWTCNYSQSQINGRLDHLVKSPVNAKLNFASIPYCLRQLGHFQ